MVHIRKIAGKSYTFIVSGKLWRNSLIMQDKETGTLWSHITGHAMEGKLEGTDLEIVPSVQTTWSRWLKQHPNTKVLKKEEEVKSSLYERYFEDSTKTGLFRTHWLRKRLPGKSLVLGLASGPHALAIKDGKIKPGNFLNVRVGDQPVLVVCSQDGGARAYLARIGDKILTFEHASGSSRATDVESNSTWDLESGTCIKGKYKGTALKPIVVRRAFWFAWSCFYPNTEVID